MKVLFFGNTDWYLYNFRLPLARYLRDRGHEVVMVSPRGSYGERLEQNGFRWIPLDMSRRSLNPLREAALVARLVAIYRQERPDLAHHFTIKCVIYGALAARAAGVRAVVNAIAGFGYVFVSQAPKARMLRPVVVRLMRMACDQPRVTVVLQNQDDLAVCRTLQLTSRDNLKLIRGSGVNISRFTPDAQPRADGPLVVLFVGRLLVDKGIVEFVDCARRVRAASGNAIRFLAAGEPDEGNPASIPADMLDKWKASADVEFLGHVDDMSSLLRRADIVMLPSYGEGAPRSLIEAAACEKPLIATDVRGCREVVQNGVNGLLVPPRDVDALVQALATLAEDPALRARMGAAGRRHVIESLDERIVFRDTYRTYEDLWSQAPAAAASFELRK